MGCKIYFSINKWTLLRLQTFFYLLPTRNCRSIHEKIFPFLGGQIAKGEVEFSL
jgi:hypothetical protein